MYTGKWHQYIDEINARLYFEQINSLHIVPGVTEALIIHQLYRGHSIYYKPKMRLLGTAQHVYRTHITWNGMDVKFICLWTAWTTVHLTHQGQAFSLISVMPFNNYYYIFCSFIKWIYLSDGHMYEFDMSVCLIRRIILSCLTFLRRFAAIFIAARSTRRTDILTRVNPDCMIQLILHVSPTQDPAGILLGNVALWELRTFHLQFVVVVRHRQSLV